VIFNSSLPGITVRRTASLPLAYDPAIHHFAKEFLAKWMDTRVKPAYDALPVNPSLILLAKMAASAAAVHRGLAADVVRSRVFSVSMWRHA
jgi:hypothetical protein